MTEELENTRDVVVNALNKDVLKSLALKHPTLPFSDAELESLVAFIKKGAGNGTVSELQDYVCEAIASKSTRHYKYDYLAGRMSVHYLHERLKNSSPLQRFMACGSFRDLNKLLIKTLEEHDEVVKKHINYERDYQYHFFGYRTFKRQYMVKDKNGDAIETPQDVLMGTCLAIHNGDLEKAFTVYENVSQLKYTFATPTISNARFDFNQTSSCFMLSINEDSIDGMYRQTVPDLASISAKAGGMSLILTKLRSAGSLIRGSGGYTTGLTQYLQLLESVARHVNQGATRKGALAVYLDIWHADVKEFVEAGSKHGNLAAKAPGLFYALMVNDLFMYRVATDGKWSLFNPQDVPELMTAYGENFDKAYAKYEAAQLYRHQVDARKMMYEICEAQIEQGGPYFMYSDTLNNKSNQSNLGTTKSSNLCTEMGEFSGIDCHGEKCTAVCNLSSISLPAFVDTDDINHDKLANIVVEIVHNINSIIDNQSYPTVEAERTNKKTRPMGIGIQGLTDVFAMLEIPHTSPKAMRINREIQETIYYTFLRTSCDIAKVNGPYESYGWNGGSYLKHGKFHWELTKQKVELSGKWDWEELRKDIAKYGIRNSLGVANMPTASTSQILGNNECFEPFTSNLYTREVLAGKYTVINKHLIKYLEKRGLWTKQMSVMLIKSKGSLQNLPLSQEAKEIFRTAFEISPLDLIKMDADRQHFVDQSQSSNRYIANPTARDLIEMHFAAWVSELKTSSYYIHTKKVEGANFVPLAESTTVQADSPVDSTDELIEPTTAQVEFDGDICRMEEGCLVCGS